MKKKIQVQNVSINFPVYENNHRSIKNKLISLSTGGIIKQDQNNIVSVTAIENISINFNEGDRVGIVGHNGSGKSTFLKAISGIYIPSRGNINVKGSVSSLLDLLGGFDPDASGYENMYIKYLFEGLKPNEISSKISYVESLTNLGNFLDFPVRTYSSGMQLRLGFGIATSIASDILIMDEWMSVGDDLFRKIANNKLKEIINSSSIFLLASHDYEQIKLHCNRLVEFKNGQIISDKKI